MAIWSDKEAVRLIPKNHAMLPRARELRRNMTPQERKLWYLFLRDYPVKFYKQRIIASFIVDFYCSAENWSSKSMERSILQCREQNTTHSAALCWRSTA